MTFNFFLCGPFINVYEFDLNTVLTSCSVELELSSGTVVCVYSQSELRMSCSSGHWESCENSSCRGHQFTTGLTHTHTQAIQSDKTNVFVFRRGDQSIRAVNNNSFMLQLLQFDCESYFWHSKPEMFNSKPLKRSYLYQQSVKIYLFKSKFCILILL